MIKWITITLHTVSALLLGYVFYLVCINEAGWTSSKQMAPIAPLLGVALYGLTVMMITDDLKQKGKLLWAIASFVIVATVFVSVINGVSAIK